MNRYDIKQLYTWAGAFCLFVAFFTILCFLAVVAWPFALTFTFAVVGVGFLWRAGQVKGV